MWYLEDLTAVIPIDLSAAKTYPLFFTEGSQVVMQGELRDGLFRVQVGIPHMRYIATLLSLKRHIVPLLKQPTFALWHKLYNNHLKKNKK